MQNAAITLRSLGSAFDDDARRRTISHPLSSRLVEGCPCGADLSSAFGAPLLQGAALLTCKNAICERNQYSLKYENTASLTFPFTPLREPTSAPSGHLLPREGGSVHASPFPWKGLPSAARRGWLPFSAAKPPPLCLPPWERRCIEKSGILVSQPSPSGKGDRVSGG